MCLSLFYINTKEFIETLGGGGTKKDGISLFLHAETRGAAAYQGYHSSAAFFMFSVSKTTFFIVWNQICKNFLDTQSWETHRQTQAEGLCLPEKLFCLFVSLIFPGAAAGRVTTSHPAAHTYLTHPAGCRMQSKAENRGGNRSVEKEKSKHARQKRKTAVFWPPWWLECSLKSPEVQSMVWEFSPHAGRAARLRKSRPIALSYLREPVPLHLQAPPPPLFSGCSPRYNTLLY